MTREEAEALWAKLNDALVNLENVIIEVINTKAWEPVGYDNLIDAWQERVKDSRKLGWRVMQYVIHEMLDSGADTGDVVEAVHGTGIGPETIEAVQRQIDYGVPPGALSRRVPTVGEDEVLVDGPFVRRKPGPRQRLQFEFSHEEYQLLKKAERELSIDIKKEGAAATVRRVRRLMNQTKK